MRTAVASLACVLLVSLPWLAVSRADADDKPAATRPSDPAAPANAVDQFIARRLAAQVVFSNEDAQHKALSFIRSNQAHADAIASMERCRTCHDGGGGAPELLATYALHAAGREGPWVGVSVGPADDVLRSQLKLPEGTGVVVTRVVPDSPAAGAGVAEHDILLSVDNQPVPDGDALDAIVKAAKPDAPPLTLRLLHEGKAVEKQVKPAQRGDVSFDHAAALALDPQYRIGVSTSAPDETLRRQLRLLGEGVVVTAVADDAPAAKQGVKLNDVLLSAAHKPLKDPQDLAAAVKAAAESPVEIELLRGGVRLKVTVTPEKTTAAETLLRAVSLDLGTTDRELMLVQPYVAWMNAATAPSPPPGRPGPHASGWTRSRPSWNSSARPWKP